MVVLDMPPLPGGAGCAGPRGPFCMPLRTSRSPIVLPLSGTRRPVGPGDAGVVDNALNSEPVPDDKHDERADSGPNKASTLLRPIPADTLADPRGHECAGDPQDCRQYESLRIVRPGEEKSGDDASNQANQEDPDKSAQNSLQRDQRKKPKIIRR